MIKLFTRFKKRDRKSSVTVAPKTPAAKPVNDGYRLPSDNPEVSPVRVFEDASDSLRLGDLTGISNRLLTPNDPDGLSSRTRAVVEVKNSLVDLCDHVRMLGQRMHAQSLGQSRLIDALSRLPETLRDVVPNGDEQQNALAAVKLALDNQRESNEQFVNALKPLPQFIETAANLPATARKQISAIFELTRQLETSNQQARETGDQVRVMVETSQQATQQAVSDLAGFQKAQLKQTMLAVKSSEQGRKSARRHQIETARAQESRLDSMQRDQNRYFNRMEAHFRRASRTQMGVAVAAVLLASASIVLASLFMAGVFDRPEPQSVAQPAQKIDPHAVVEND